MTDSNDDKTLNGPGKKTLTLKPSGMSQGTVRQDMGRGRTKAVVVETRKRRPMRPEDERPITPGTAAAPARAAEPAPVAHQPRAPQAPAPRIHPSGGQQSRPQQPSSQPLHGLSIDHPLRASTFRARASSFCCALSTFGNSSPSEASASMIAAATTTRVNHL